MPYSELRKEYSQRGLSEQDLDADPFRQFGVWLDLAIAASLPEPNAMALATADAGGHPSVRMVLLKGLDTGFVFYTNYESRKGNELAQNDWAALAFYWAEMERQVRVEGRVEQVTTEMSDMYFHSRPIGSQIGAAASHQSQIIPGRDVLERRAQELSEQYQGQEIPRPQNWGGYRVIPHTIEFWQGRQDRLHDRLRYRREANEQWIIERLSP